MQIFLLSVTVILAIVLYRMLSVRRATYPFVRTTRISRTENGAEFLATEAEQGIITVDNDVVIVEGVEYALKENKNRRVQASLNIDNGKLISISIKLADGEKLYFVNPEHNLFSDYQESLSESKVHYTFSL